MSDGDDNGSNWLSIENEADRCLHTRLEFASILERQSNAGNTDEEEYIKGTSDNISGVTSEEDEEGTRGDVDEDQDEEEEANEDEDGNADDEDGKVVDLEAREQFVDGEVEVVVIAEPDEAGKAEAEEDMKVTTKPTDDGTTEPDLEVGADGVHDSKSGTEEEAAPFE
jgi:hypothetical protein